MNTLANIVTKYAWLVLGVLVLVLGSAFYIGIRPEPEDDILKFLPPEDQDVKRFRHISELFGGLEVAMVGIEVPDVFDPAFLKKLDALTSDLRDTQGVDRVVSLTNLADFEPDKVNRGIKAGELVDVRQFGKPGYLAGLRQRVLGKNHVVGQFVNPEGKATLVMCFLVPGVNQTQVTARIKDAVRRILPEDKIYWGGAPFVASYIFGATSRDLDRLTPYALVAIVLVMLIAFKDPLGVFLSLLTTGIGVIVTFSLMVAFKVKLNIMLSTMPVILFACASAYGIHLLSRFYRLSETLDKKEAMRQALLKVGLPIIGTALTTIGGFISFLAMDIPPMRLFGLFASVGIFASMLTAIFVIPAVIAVVPKLPRFSFGKGSGGGSWLTRRIGDMSAGTMRYRYVSLGVAAVLGVAGFYYAAKCRVTVEPSAFYEAGSEPDKADAFLGRAFGGSQYLQVHVDLAAEKADDQSFAAAVEPFFPNVRHRTKPVIEDPLVLREIRRFAEKVALLPEVSSALHIGLPIALGNEMAEDIRRIPDTRAKVKNIYGLVSTDPTISQLLSPSHKDVLVHVKVKSSKLAVVNQVMAKVERMLEEDFRHAFRRVELRQEKDAQVRARAVDVLIADTADHVLAEAELHGLKPAQGSRERLIQAFRGAFEKPPQVTPESREAVASNLAGYLVSSEFPGTWPKATEDGTAIDRPAVAGAIARSLAAAGPGVNEDARDAAVKAAAGKLLGEARCLDFSTFVEQELEHSWRVRRYYQLGEEARKALGLGTLNEEQQRLLATAAGDLDAPDVALPLPRGASGPGVTGIQPVVSGMPVVLRGMARSVGRNQILSTGVSLSVVFLIMVWIFRSFAGGAVAMLPPTLTLVAVFGGLYVSGRNMDIGTSMVSGIALGVGVDYAIHYLSWWQQRSDGNWAETARTAASEAGGGILANAIMVSVGFVVLATGEAQPLKIFGIMTAAAMLVAVLVTFLYIPITAGKREYYQREHESGPPLAAEEAVPAALQAAVERRS
jgi:predicted RND superfamily exporter protein